MKCNICNTNQFNLEYLKLHIYNTHRNDYADFIIFIDNLESRYREAEGLDFVEYDDNDVEHLSGHDTFTENYS